MSKTQKERDLDEREAILAAREERLKVMQGGAALAQDGCNQQAAIGGYVTQEYRVPTLAEQAEKNAQYHFEEHAKSQKAASFLTAHPEFDEFIKLIRAGSIQFLVFFVCVIAAFAQKPAPDPAPALAASQQIALKSIEDKEKDLQQQWNVLQAEKSAIVAEYSTEHPGWFLGPNNVPTKTAPATPPAPAPKK